MREWFIIFIVLLIFIDIYLSASVYVDAKRIKDPALGVPSQIWGLISFLFPLLGFFIYWLMHHSALSKKNRN